MTAERRLAALLAADVEGSARLMGLDEEGTLRTLTVRRAISTLDRFSRKSNHLVVPS